MTKIKSEFKDKKLWDMALTHRSWVNEHKGDREHNERLEFLGDAVLEYLVSSDLYKRFDEKKEGYLTALRANLVNTTNLAKVAQKIGVGEMLFLSKGEEESGGRKNKSLLANTVEAIIGAIYLDRGMEAAKEFVEKYVLVDVEKKITEPLKDAKSRLQELVQAKKYESPKYKIESEKGPDHDKSFIVSVFVNGKKLAVGEGKSKSEAEQGAADVALKKMEGSV